jgi:hypothetical protein
VREVSVLQVFKTKARTDTADSIQGFIPNARGWSRPLRGRKAALPNRRRQVLRVPARCKAQLADLRVDHRHMEKMFYLLGRPGEIKCDNGPCFRTEFKNWAKDRDIIVNNSAPNKPTSNGLAERAVGIVKHMLLKHHLNYEAFMHALMEFRLTPRTDSYLPSQVFYSRRIKTDAPITAAALRTRTDLSAAESSRQRVSDSKRNSASKQSTTRPDMISGKTVSVQNPTTKRWDKREIIIKARDTRNRTFQVKIDGTIWTCSELFLRPVHQVGQCRLHSAAATAGRKEDAADARRNKN